MIITPHERLRYFVTSRSGKEPYLVDIGSNRKEGLCLGNCTCDGFRTTLAKWRELGLPVSDAWRCAHIRAARLYAFDEFLDKFVTQIRTTYNDYRLEEE